MSCSWSEKIFLCLFILKALCNVPPLRNYFLEEENYRGIRRPPGDIMFLLVHRFGELMRKLWNPRNFKAHVSPHEMLQAVVLCSKKTFQITKQGTTLQTDVPRWECNTALHQYCLFTWKWRFRREDDKLAVMLCLSCRGCCGLSFLVPKCPAWSSGWNQEETM